MDRQIWQDELLGRCAELAYFFLFSIFPLLLFLTTLLGYAAGASDELRKNLFLYLAEVSPSVEVFDLLVGTLTEITRERTGVKLWLSLLVTIWVASNGMLAVARTLNHACGLKETRPLWKRRGHRHRAHLQLGRAHRLGALPHPLRRHHRQALWPSASASAPPSPSLGIVLQWPLVLVFLVIGFEMVYNYAPNLGDSPARQWGTPGAITGVALWLLASFGLRLYLSYFGAFSTAYGSLGAVIVLLLWFYLTAFAILMGGEVNSEIAREISEQRRLREEAEGIAPHHRQRRRRWRRR